MSRAGRGRPLRFVGMVVCGWIGMRLVVLGSVPTQAPSPSPSPRGPAAARPVLPVPLAPIARQEAVHALAPAARPGKVRSLAAAATAIPMLADAPRLEDVKPAEATAAPRLPVASVLPSTSPIAMRRPRWQASAWLVLRPGRGVGAAPGAGQIGGSQYGIRLRHPLDRRARIAAYGRIAGPVRARGAEAALGIEWQPFRANLRLAAEQRIGLDGGGGGPGIGMVAGVDRRLLGAFRLEAYGQSGILARTRVEPYADGALRITRPAATGRRTSLAIGIGAWGAAQRDAQRLDIGPSLVAELPIGAAHARLALDWRQRIAGGARPGSGVALTLGSDF